MSDGASVLVFDGECVLCHRSVRFVLRHDRERRYRFAACQSDFGQALLREKGMDPAAPVSVLLLERGNVYTESTAILRVLAGFGGGWSWLARAARVLPRRACDRLYRWIARHRYTWFGRHDVCPMPNAEDAARFLD